MKPLDRFPKPPRDPWHNIGIRLWMDLEVDFPLPVANLVEWWMP